jgi:hypothetical protein
LNFASKITRQSRLSGFEGVSSTIQKETEGARLALAVANEEAIERLWTLDRDRQGFYKGLVASIGKPLDEILTSELSDIENTTLEGLNRRIQSETSRIEAERFRAYFKSIDGFEIDGVKPDADAMINGAPRELYQENRNPPTPRGQ